MRRQSTSGGLVAAVAVTFALIAGGCGDDGDGGPAASADTSDATVGGTTGAGDFPCGAWDDLATFLDTEGPPPIEVVEAAVSGVEALGEVEGIASDDLGRIDRYLDVVAALIDEFGDAESVVFDEVDPADLNAIDDGADALAALYATNDVSVRAHEDCDGVADPRFNLPCGTGSGFRAVPEPTPGGDEPPPIENEAHARLERADGASDVAIRETPDDTYELAMLDDDGVALSIVEVVASDGQWAEIITSSCEVAEAGFTPVGP